MNAEPPSKQGGKLKTEQKLSGKDTLFTPRNGKSTSETGDGSVPTLGDLPGFRAEVENVAEC